MKFFLLFVMVFLASPYFAYGQTVIENNISASANTGGAKGGKTVEIFSQTTVDGELIEEIDRKISEVGEGELRLESNSSIEKLESEIKLETRTSISTTSQSSSATVATSTKKEVLEQETASDEPSHISRWLKSIFKYVLSLF